MLVCKGYDNTIRWREGERLDHLFEETCDRLDESHVAAMSDDEIVTYRELDARANRLARYLKTQGIQPGDRIGLLFSKSIYTYVALLGVLKANAAYVPLDPGFPGDRISYICEDAEVKAIVTLDMFAPKVADLGLPVITLDGAAQEIATQEAGRLSPEEKGSDEDQLTYIIYTSGSTGRPKGVAIEHPSICNFCRVAADVYGIVETDRMYQGMTIAFDFSVEELWVPLIAGATLVPGREDTNLLGADLANFLIDNEITAMCCVPTLLATIDVDLPKLRFLLVSGEACPYDLVARWHRKDRTFLNAYGPTEATVTATWTELFPGKPVTIGGPLPTYTIVILDEVEDKLVEEGGMGEIAIAGIGLALGYVNRDDLTEKAFVPDFLDLPDNPSKRIYRTGDLGRINDDDEVEFHGRIDTQVKVRGYRIELTEIESVLMEMPQIAVAVVNTYESEPGNVELAAFYTLKEGETELPVDDVSSLMRSRLPAYMVPAYLERIDEMPMLPSHKADRKSLPDPAGPRFVATGGNIVAARTETEKTVASSLAAVLGIDEVSVEDNFFYDLGAHSLLMTQLSADLREKFPQSELSMRDIYLYPTVAQLAGHLETAEKSDLPAVEARPQHIASAGDYWLCGALQALFYMAFVPAGFAVFLLGIQWIVASTSMTDIYVRTVVFGLGAFIGWSSLPLIAKWLLIGRWEAETIPIWSLAYFRFWVVKTLVQTNPMIAFAGSPLYSVYLRLLGAKIGSGAVIHAKYTPVCADLIEIGDNAVIRKDSIMLGYRARGGYIETGPVTMGRNTFVGEASVLDIGTVMEDDTQLGHSSSLQSGQVVPQGKHYHGLPAQETTADYNALGHEPCATLRKTLYSIYQIATAFFVLAPVTVWLVFYFFPWIFGGETNLWSLLTQLPDVTVLRVFYVALITLGLVVVSIGVSLAVIGIVPRLLNVFLEGGREYPLYGFHYFVFRMVSAASNSNYFNVLFGDSSYIVHYLRYIGIDMCRIVQTGSNFGTNQKHDTPFLCRVGTGTMVSDGLSMINAQFGSGSFKLSQVAIGENNFFGNNVHFPPDAKTGDNVLFATKVLVPIDGRVRENTGLLGSPSFEIPRSVERDTALRQELDPDAKAARLKAKNASNIATVILFLFAQWLYGFIALVGGYYALTLYPTHGIWPLLVALVIGAVFSIAYFVLVERASLGFKRLKPTACTVLDEEFWAVERHWKLAEHPLMGLFAGTPFKNTITRLLGIRMGTMIFDDGCIVTEKTLVSIGDHATLNVGATLQAHSLEDGVFKSDAIALQGSTTVGVNAYVHYGVTMGEGSTLEADAFLMKGETIGAGEVWRGNPAREV